MTSRRSALKLFLLSVLAACDSAIARLRGARLVPIARIDQVQPGSAYRTKHGDDPLILVNVGGKVSTFLAVCTHEGCPLGWNQNQHLIRCPCHGSAFDTSGRVVNGPALLPLTPLHTIAERGEVLLVEMPKRGASAPSS
jgi:cytochrome b6-f complex iron-sulfur subunit